MTRELVDDPRKILKVVLERPDEAAGKYTRAAVREFTDWFDTEHGVRLALSDEAVVMAVGLAGQVDQSLRSFLVRTFEPHKDFLRKILEKSGRDELPVTPQILKTPAEGVEIWLARKEG